MKISRLSPRYEEELLELADKADNLAAASKMPMPATMHVELLAQGLNEIAKDLRFMVKDNERFLNS